MDSRRRLAVACALLTWVASVAALPVEVREATLQNVHRLALASVVLLAAIFLLVLLHLAFDCVKTLCCRRSPASNTFVLGSGRGSSQDF